MIEIFYVLFAVFIVIVIFEKVVKYCNRTKFIEDKLP